jgi:hypothetical protein
MPAVEIISSGPERGGPLEAILREQQGIAYHVCFEVQNSEQAVKSLEEARIRVIPISPRKPAVLFKGKAVSFFQVVGFGLVEFVEPDW